MVPSCTLNIDDQMQATAKECIDSMHSSGSAAEFGYKVQALAAHVLLRLSYTVDIINQSGHPDIVASKDKYEFRFEVEAEWGHPRLRKPSDDDIASLVGGAGVAGYYALALHFPTPRWILVPASKLAGRTRPSANMLLEALSDRPQSLAWTCTYIRLLHEASRQIRVTSYHELSRIALEGRGL